MNPFESLKSELDKLAERVKVDIQVSLYKELASLFVSRLAILEPQSAQKYTDIVNNLNSKPIDIKVSDSMQVNDAVSL